MALWSMILHIFTFPGRIAAKFAPNLDGEHRRLLEHMANYIFWLTPTLGLVTWYAIHRAMTLAMQ